MLGSWCQQKHHEMEQAAFIKGFILSCAEKMPISLSPAVTGITTITFGETRHPEGLKLQTQSLISSSKPQGKSKLCQK